MLFIFTRLPFVFFLYFFFFSLFLFSSHIQPHNPHPRTSSPWSSLFFSFSLNLTTHSPHPRTSSPWSSHVISLNFTKNLQYLSLFVTPKPNGNWSQIDASELLLITQPQLCRKIQIGLLRVRLAIEVSTYCSYYFLCLSFQFSVYFVVSEIRVIWFISYISNENIDQKHFCVCKSSLNLSTHFGSILFISKYSFFHKVKKTRSKTLPTLKKCVLTSKNRNKQVHSLSKKTST